MIVTHTHTHITSFISLGILAERKEIKFTFALRVFFHLLVGDEELQKNLKKVSYERKLQEKKKQKTKDRRQLRLIIPLLVFLSPIARKSHDLHQADKKRSLLYS